MDLAASRICSSKFSVSSACCKETGRSHGAPVEEAGLLRHYAPLPAPRPPTLGLARGFSCSSFLAAASMDAAAPSSSVSAITVGSSGVEVIFEFIHDNTEGALTLHGLRGLDELRHGARYSLGTRGEVVLLVAELPAATALAVAMVMPFVMRMNSSGVVVLLGASRDLNTCGRHSGMRGVESTF
ncbi:hypothetical protein EYF80_001972 [Liparis tanakae]|uniref:Uncharacterized protein n=1 Tax=Liparis tanakae TaxID=230148 RepID=A0A4Z2JBC1_9TELE|nr:hypothetical protein EYF80_001972 [Liparis tanakae]